MRHSLELKVPPAIVFAGALFAVWLLSRLSEPGFWWGLELAGRLLIGAGALVIVAATLQFRRHRTTLDPREPDKATALLTRGIFAFSRNPIYLAFGLIVLGFALAAESVAALIVAPSFMAYLQLFQIKPEEAYLRQKFGQRYLNYCQRTRRWLGRTLTDDAR
ncbi:isoprenylcysteine carboxylmethyltransferase family protein [Salinimonas marina]|uniref:Isoprenylcysteine carboxylmethyltransferase family protein n=1 Tax=Salinimonas marina TaxID=2785918 RepID=A0A7S9HE78_9ALTE|nr:isoprenylcysteine carboxylmethyltransferase family protein [Salinimonas marina]QPG06697.1 isoprenylcysteine carboxylmethyltransferase family protein [Salinimonas marina]